MAKLLLPKKRKADESVVEETAVAGDEAEKPTQAGDEPPKKSRKTSTPKKRKVLPKANASRERTTALTASANIDEIATQTDADRSGEANELVPAAPDLITTNDKLKPPAEKFQPKKAKTSKADASKNISPDTSGLSDPVSSPKDSGTEANGAATEGSKTAVKDSKKPKKRASPRKTATNVRRNKKQTEDAAQEAMPPPPLPPPAPINQQVANKVKQVLLFIKDDENQHTKLERDPKNPARICVPYSSFQSAVMRMQAHYEIAQSIDQCINDVQDIIVNNFKRNIGPTPNIDWVTIDVSKPSIFEDCIKRKIARHGLDGLGLSLLEIELKMFTKDLQEKTHLFRDLNGEPVVTLSNRLLDAVGSASEETAPPEQTTTEQTTDLSAEHGKESKAKKEPETGSPALI